MGTRGFLTFAIDGVEKTSYVHSDAYPEGKGLVVLNFLTAHRHELLCDQCQGQCGATVDKIRRLRVVGPYSEPTPWDIERLAKFTNVGVGSQGTDDWYCLLRETQGNPALILEAGVIEDASDLPAEPQARYGYVIDIDAKAFEVYAGGPRERHDRGRFANRTSALDGFYPAALVASWPLDALPDEASFLAAFSIPTTSGDAR